MLISILLALLLIGAVVVALLPREEEEQARHVGLFFSLITFFVSLGILVGFDATQAGMQFEENIAWVPSLGISYHVGIDGISLWLVLLTTFLSPVVIFSTYGSIRHKIKQLTVALLVLELGMLGAFVALDLFLFYVFWEIMLVPMYLIIGVWGHERRIYAAVKLVIYTMLGSLLMLVAIVYMYVTHGQATGNYTFDYQILSQSIWGQDAQLWLFAAFALAFAIKVPMFPVHTWLPDAHVEAPTAGSIILAGVLLKLGTYGFLRFAIPLFPWAAYQFAPYIALLAVIGIVYGALVAYAQSDAKKLVAYSSVSHMGFIMLGMMAMTTSGVQGSLYQMLNHGISTGGLFLAVGVLYDRRHTHELSQFGGLWKRMPVFGALFLVVLLSSAGLPGLNGFVGEFLILLGSFTHDQQQVALGKEFIPHAKLMTAIAALGVVLGAVYLLHLFQKLMLGPLKHQKNEALEDVTVKERLSFVPLLILIFVMGIYPKPFLQRMEPSVNHYLKTYQTKLAQSMTYEGEQPKRLAELDDQETHKIRALAQNAMQQSGGAR